MADTKKTEESESVSRRDLFQILGAAPLLAGVPAAVVAQEHQHHQAAGAANGAGPYQRKTFDDHQWQTVRVLCDLILPADERSGSATQAGVPEFLDDWIAFRTEEDGNRDLEAEIFGGLTWLDREARRLYQSDFASAPPNEQRKLLDRIAYPDRAAKEDHPWVYFFNEFRSLTVSGFFSSKMGVADLPYLGNRLVVEWKGCDPKVWATLEERMKNGYKGVVEAKPWGEAS